MAMAAKAIMRAFFMEARALPLSLAHDHVKFFCNGYIRNLQSFGTFGPCIEEAKSLLKPPNYVVNGLDFAAHFYRVVPLYNIF